MLELRNVTRAFDEKRRRQKAAIFALQDVSLSLPSQGLVFVCGPSGSGKSTLLNILGGLDKVTDGTFIVDGQDTAKFSEAQWNAYRREYAASIAQNAPLIDYRTVLSNVSLGCELAGFDASQARERARIVLSLLGIEDMEDTMPATLSPGERQTVCIAQAIATDAPLILADEPVALMDDAKTAAALAQLQRLATNRLVVIATRKPYPGIQADCVVQLDRGHIASINTQAADLTIPLAAKAASAFNPQQEKPRRTKHRLTALNAWALSLAHQKEKSSRNTGTTIAGFLGIVGIALILAITTGVQNYVDRAETLTLSAFPLEITGTGSKTEVNLTTATVNTTQGDASSLLTSVSKSTTNDLESLKAYFDSGTSGIEAQTNAVEYRYNVTPQFYLEDTSAGATAASPNAMLSLFGALTMVSSSQVASLSLTSEVFHAMPTTKSLYESSYEVLEGRWPESDTECVVVLDSSGKVDDYILYCLGLKSQNTLVDSVRDLLLGSDEQKAAQLEARNVDYADLLGARFKLVCSADYYQRDTVYGGWKNTSSDNAYLTSLVNAGETATVVGVVKPNPDLVLPTLDTGINYPLSLQTHMAAQAAGKEIVLEQLADPEVDVLTGLTFEELSQTSVSTRIDEYTAALANLGNAKINDAVGVVDVTAEALADAFGIAGNLVTIMKEIGSKAISIDLKEIIGELQKAGFNYPQFPLPTDKHFEEAGITKVPSTAKEAISEAMLVLIKNEQSSFPYQVAMMTPEDILEKFSLWMSSSDHTVIIDDVDTGLTPGEFMRTVMETALSQTVSAAQCQTFVVSYLKDSFIPYIQGIAKDVSDKFTQKATEAINAILTEAGLPKLEGDIEKLTNTINKLLDLQTLSSQLIYYTGMLVKERGSSMDSNLSTFGYAWKEVPSKIYLYPNSLDGKDNIAKIIEGYNSQVIEAGETDKEIVYLDPIGSVGKIIVAIARVIGLLPALLISLSVIVYIVMVGSTTTLCARLRRQEFGLMRSFGSSRSDIRRLVLAEAGMQGLLSSIAAVVLVWIVCLVANGIIHSALSISGLIELPIATALIVIITCTILTTIAGIIPAIKAARNPIAESIAR